MAYDPRMAAALSGATLGQLQYWRRGDRPILTPEVSADAPFLYSFRDLVALRTFVMLREDRSLQAIRKALNNLRDLGAVEHLSQYRLVSQGQRSIVLVADTGTGATDLVESPGQEVTVVKLGDVVKSFPLDDFEVPNLARPRQRIAVDPSTRHGIPVVIGTRVTYDKVASLIRDGITPEHIADYYPGVGAEAARDAASFADYVDRAAQRRRKTA